MNTSPRAKPEHSLEKRGGGGEAQGCSDCCMGSVRLLLDLCFCFLHFLLQFLLLLLNLLLRLVLRLLDVFLRLVLCLLNGLLSRLLLCFFLGCRLGCRRLRLGFVARLS